jgi:23S rRNA pseudouridine1911/1915/1917 synthase
MASINCNGMNIMALNQGWCYEEVVTKSASGKSILDYYSDRYSHSTREEWLARIVAGDVQVNNNSVAPDWQLIIGQKLCYYRSPWQEPDVPLAFTTLYEDEDLWVIDKPSGLPVLPGAGFLEHTVLGQLRLRIATETPTPIHRLGRGTSGCLLLARSALAKSNLSQQLRDRQLEKIYRTLIGPTPDSMPIQGTITTPIGKISYPQLGYLYAATADGLAAESSYQIVNRSAEFTWVDVTIATGRPHQIRIHMASIGYPLVDDPLYGIGGVPMATDAVPGDCGYSLHARQLGFRHPRSGDWMTIEAPIPGPLQI